MGRSEVPFGRRSLGEADLDHYIQESRRSCEAIVCDGSFQQVSRVVFSAISMVSRCPAYSGRDLTYTSRACLEDSETSLQDPRR